MKKLTDVYVIGVGMTNFTKPQSTGKDYPELVKEAVSEALSDAQLTYDRIEQAFVSYLYGGTCSGQRALYDIGLTGIPIYNVNNACASGSSGVFLSKQLIESGNADVVMAVGFERMASGSLEALQPQIDDRALPIDMHIQLISDTYGLQPAPIMAQLFGNAGKEHMEKYGTKREHFAKIAYKNHRHSVNNSKSQFRKEYSLDEILSARNVHDFMGLLECSPTSDGAAAVVLCSESFLNKNPHLKSQAVQIIGMELGTDQPSVFSEKSMIKLIGFDMVKNLSQKLYKNTGIGPEQIQVIELHDCFAPNELISYEALGLCPIGKGGDLVDKGNNTYGGKWVINPSGGLISKGHPIGATGVAQVVELSNQLRQRCGLRQVPNVKYALQHNIGIGGACVVAIYKLGFSGLVKGKDIGEAPKPTPAQNFKSDLIFEEIRERAEKEEQVGKNVDSVFKFVINSGGAKKIWIIDLKRTPPHIGQLPPDDKSKADAEFVISDEDFIRLSSGKLKPDQAFMQGKMKIRGNIAKAMKLKTVLDPARLRSRI